MSKNIISYGVYCVYVDKEEIYRTKKVDRKKAFKVCLVTNRFTYAFSDLLNKFKDVDFINVHKLKETLRSMTDEERYMIVSKPFEYIFEKYYRSCKFIEETGSVYNDSSFKKGRFDLWDKYIKCYETQELTYTVSSLINETEVRDQDEYAMVQKSLISIPKGRIDKTDTSPNGITKHINCSYRELYEETNVNNVFHDFEFNRRTRFDKIYDIRSSLCLVDDMDQGRFNYKSISQSLEIASVKWYSYEMAKCYAPKNVFEDIKRIFNYLKRRLNPERVRAIFDNDRAPIKFHRGENDLERFPYPTIDKPVFIRIPDAKK